MGCILKVLVPVTDLYEDYTLEEIYDDLINNRLFNDFGTGIFDYFSFWDTVNQDEAFFGRDNPQRMIKEVEKWNKDLISCLTKELDNIAPLKTSDDILKYFEETPFAAYRLREALNAYDDHLQYGGYRLAYLKEGDYRIRLPYDTIKDIMNHPEDYAIIEVVYH